MLEFSNKKNILISIFLITLGFLITLFFGIVSIPATIYLGYSTMNWGNYADMVIRYIINLIIVVFGAVLLNFGVFLSIKRYKYLKSLQLISDRKVQKILGYFLIQFGMVFILYFGLISILPFLSVLLYYSFKNYDLGYYSLYLNFWLFGCLIFPFGLYLEATSKQYLIHN